MKRLVRQYVRRRNEYCCPDDSPEGYAKSAQAWHETVNNAKSVARYRMSQLLEQNEKEISEEIPARDLSLTFNLIEQATIHAVKEIWGPNGVWRMSIWNQGDIDEIRADVKAFVGEWVRQRGMVVPKNVDL